MHTEHEFRTTEQWQSHIEEIGDRGHDIVHAPEIDPGSGLTAVTFLIGALIVLRGKRLAR